MAKTKAQQDDQAGPFTRATRSAMVAIDKIASMEDEDYRERVNAIHRIMKYGNTIGSELTTEAWDKDAQESDTSPP